MNIFIQKVIPTIAVQISYSNPIMSTKKKTVKKIIPANKLDTIQKGAYFLAFFGERPFHKATKERSFFSHLFTPRLSQKTDNGIRPIYKIQLNTKTTCNVFQFIYDNSNRNS